VTELSFMRGTESPRLVWTVTGWATPEQLASAIELAQSDDVAEVLNVAAPVAQAQAAAALSGPAPQPAPVAEAPKAEPAPQVAEAPKAEAAPAEAAAEAPASQDPAALMAQLQALLGGKA